MKNYRCEEHDRIKYQCKECKGGSICEHNRRRTLCKECKGGSICENDRELGQNERGEGGSFCEHNRIRSRCKECEGGSFCEHNRIRCNCKECGGTSICKHNRIIYQCKECKGRAVCEHNRMRYNCKECGGTSICKHNRDRYHCSECGMGLCPKCGLWQTQGKLCSTCNPNSRKRKRYDENRIEIKMLKFIQEKVPWTIVYPEQNFGEYCGYKNKKYDCVLFSKTKKYVIVIECDEHWHRNYPENCEWTRPFAAYDIFEKPVLFIRWNPDAWKVDGETIRMTKTQKMEKLWNYMEPFIHEEEHTRQLFAVSNVKVATLYYPTITANPIYEYTNEEIDSKIKMLFSM